MMNFLSIIFPMESEYKNALKCYTAKQYDLWASLLFMGDAE